jgi:hypothetical protein
VRPSADLQGGAGAEAVGVAHRSKAIDGPGP